MIFIPIETVTYQNTMDQNAVLQLSNIVAGVPMASHLKNNIACPIVRFFRFDIPAEQIDRQKLHQTELKKMLSNIKKLHYTHR